MHSISLPPLSFSFDFIVFLLFFFGSLGKGKRQWKLPVCNALISKAYFLFSFLFPGEQLGRCLVDVCDRSS
jgi:hypothetical protein